MYRKLKKKYNRPAVEVAQSSARSKRNQRLPEIIPLDDEDVPTNPNNQSGSGHVFDRNPVKLTRNNMPAQVDDKSISLLNSELPGYQKNSKPQVLLHEQNSAGSFDFRSNTLQAAGSGRLSKKEAPAIVKTRTEVKQNRESLFDTQ